ncbi:MAG: bifunctional folylpolyglutamate synthase/dihydrofolate synthase [Elusimicrobiota bacterium]|jgi:dihydrofolate synthase/folylpolyglutamate synthase|nr:bifunctional folylpolyglutamate synthase/dihydrofolate synthase [Elusimicrobiota bacterium]
MMNYPGSLTEYENMKPGLSRIRKFLKALGNPQNKLQYIHIAGTNGKGSTASYLANMLQQNGYKTALYSSPHLIDITERIKVNGQNIGKKSFAILFKKYFHFAKKYKLSFFEYITGLTFIFFEKQKADIVVLEAGLGGRFDATNIIAKPLICIITTISLDHTALLGKTIKKISFEKSGIIKKGAQTIVGALSKDALNEIYKKAKPYIYNKDFKASGRFIAADFQKFNYQSADGVFIKNIKLQMSGAHQIQNACLAICAINLLRGKGFIINENKIKKALFDTKIPARFDERILRIKNKKLKIIIDGAHNEEAVKAFINQWKDRKYNSNNALFIFAMMKDKDYKNAISLLAPIMSKVVCPQLKSKRACAPKILRKELLKFLPQSSVLEAASVKDALNNVKNTDRVIAIGSLYLAGEILELDAV